jgi:EamA domain-containing membrane protein RarD
LYSKAGFVLALFTTMLWGTLPVVIKPLLASMSTITITWYRYAVSAILLTGVPALARKAAHSRRSSLDCAMARWRSDRFRR